MPNRDVYQEVTNTIIELLEQGTAPWRKPWASDGSLANGYPRNAATRRHYNGVNVLLLWAKAVNAGFTQRGWLTFKQAKDAGGSVRRGEKGTQVVFFKFIEDKKDPKKRIPLARSFTVFNLDQVDGVDHLREAQPEPVTPGDVERLAHVEQFLRAQGAALHVEGDRAFYQPSADRIVVPPSEKFASTAGYYGTVLHELTHWTAHESRCDRDMSGRFGDESYAMEELVAELGAAFLGAEFGIDTSDTREGIASHASYLDHWLTVLKSDKRAIFTAASAATRAVEWLHDNAAELEQAA